VLVIVGRLLLLLRERRFSLSPCHCLLSQPSALPGCMVRRRGPGPCVWAVVVAVLVVLVHIGLPFVC